MIAFWKPMLSLSRYIYFFLRTTTRCLRRLSTWAVNAHRADPLELLRDHAKWHLYVIVLQALVINGVSISDCFTEQRHISAMVNFTFNELSTSTKPCIALYARYRLYQRQIQNIEVMKT